MKQARCSSVIRLDGKCPVCGTSILGVAPGVVLCEECHIPHHSDCYKENGGCGIFGCKNATHYESARIDGADPLAPQIQKPIQAADSNVSWGLCGLTASTGTIGVVLVAMGLMDSAYLVPWEMLVVCLGVLYWHAGSSLKIG